MVVLVWIVYAVDELPAEMGDAPGYALIAGLLAVALLLPAVALVAAVVYSLALCLAGGCSARRAHGGSGNRECLREDYNFFISFRSSYNCEVCSLDKRCSKASRSGADGGLLGLLS